MKTTSSVLQPRSRWLDWQPQAINISKTAREEPSKPTERLLTGTGSLGLVPHTKDQPELHCEHEVASGDEEKGTSSVIAGRTVKQLFFEDTVDACFQDSDGRCLHYDVVMDSLTELVAGMADPEAPIPAQAWRAYGTLLGLVVQSREREESTGDGRGERVEPPSDYVSDGAALGDDSTPQGDLNVAERKSTPWPDFIPGYGEKSITSFTECAKCGAGTWLRFGGKALCNLCVGQSMKRGS